MAASSPILEPVESYRAALQRFFASQANGVPLALLRLLRFGFGWSVFCPQRIPAEGLDKALHGERVNAIELARVEGLHALAAYLSGAPAGAALPEAAVQLAQGCATEMNRPMVREEAFRALFSWLQRAAGAGSYRGAGNSPGS